VQVPSFPAETKGRCTGRREALTYIRPVATARNLYLRPLSGPAEVQLTHFAEEPSDIVAYAWSRDDKKIAMTGARFNNTDVVMISGFR
jgi:hypothetical protein